MAGDRHEAKARILSSATEIAQELGTAHLSLEAVAARAGVSKGGLLYHFPTKAKLLEAIVADHVEGLKRMLEEGMKMRASHPNAFAEAFVEAFSSDCGSGRDKPPAGVLAAIAENPEFIDPVRIFQADLVARFKASCADPVMAMIAFLAIEGMRSLKLFDVMALTSEDERAVVTRLLSLLEA